MLINYDNYDGFYFDQEKFLEKQSIVFDSETETYWGGAGFFGTSHVSTYDGDTATLFYPTFISDITGSASTRFFLIDSPELSPYEEWGDEAKEFTDEILKQAEHIIIQTDTGSEVTDHYGRLLGWIWVKPPGKNKYYSLNYLTVRNGFSYYGYPYNTGVEEEMVYDGIDYRSWMLLAAYRAEENELGVHGTQPASEFVFDWTSYFDYEEDQTEPEYTIPTGIPDKIDAILTIKSEMKEKFIENNIDMTDAKFVEYPDKIEELALYGKEALVEDIEGNTWTPQLLFKRNESPYDYSTLSWVIDDTTDSKNIILEGVILSWGDFVEESDTYAGTINTMDKDETYFYVGGVSARDLRAYDKDTLSLAFTSSDQGGTINAVLATDNYVYAGGDDGNLRMYNKIDGAIVAEDASEQQSDSIHSLTADESLLYVGRANGKVVSYVKDAYFEENNFLHWRDDNFSVPTTEEIVSIRADKNPDNDNDQLYIAVDTYVYKYEKQGFDWTKIGRLNYNGTIYDMDTDDDFIYVAGSTNDSVIKFSKDSLEFVGTTPAYPSRLEAVKVDDNYIYAGGLSEEKIYIYSKTTMQFLDSSEPYGGTIREIILDGNYVYAGGTSTNKVREFNNFFTLFEIREDEV